MKSVYEKFTEKEFKELKKIKGDKSWHKFILDLAGVPIENGGN